MIDITTEAELDSVLNQNDDVVVLFTAPAWCIPCRRLEFHWERTVTEVDKTFVRVNMGDEPEQTSLHWATDRFNILGVPAIKRFVGDEVIDVKGRGVVALIKELS